MTDYCEVNFSWKSNKNTNLIVEYCVVDGNILSESDCTSQLFANQVELSAESESSECQLNVSCKSLYKVAICKIDIVCESRILELYDNREGYLLSVRGVALPENGDGDVNRLCKIECNFGDPLRSFYGKFKSIPRKNVFEIVQLKIYLSSCDNDLYHQDEASSINVTKLKMFVAELGDQVPDNARSLLDAMEQYQKNKSSTVGDIKKQLCQESLGQDQSMVGMGKMLSMFSQLNSQTTNQADSQDLLFSVISSAQNGNKTDQEGIYQFFHNICGQVSDMRVPPLSPVNEGTVKENRSEQVCSAAKSIRSDADNAINEKLQEMEKQVLTQVDEKINALEQRLSSKLDLILQSLNIQVPKHKDLDDMD